MPVGLAIDVEAGHASGGGGKVCECNREDSASNDGEADTQSRPSQDGDSFPTPSVASSGVPALRTGAEPGGKTTLGGNAEPLQPEHVEVAVPVEKAPVPAAPSKPPPPSRAFVLDNSKFFLTMCVVGTHTLGVFVGKRPFSTWFHAAAYVFMMPTYVFISGYCSSPDLSRQKKVDGVIKVAAIFFLSNLIWLLLVFYCGRLWATTWYGQVIAANGAAYMDRDGAVGGVFWRAENWLNPYWQLWYLLFLVFWRLMLPFWWRLRFPVAAAWLLCALFTGFQVKAQQGKFTLDANGIVGWFPLFCLGTAAKERGWKVWENPWSRPLGWAVLLSLAWLPMITKKPEEDPLFGVNGAIWHYDGSMDKLDSWTGGGFGGHCLKTLFRLAVPLVQALCIWATLHVMPRREWRVITSFGSRSLANYVFHPLSGMVFSYIGVYGPRTGSWNMEGAPSWAEPAIVALIVPTSLFWMSPWVWKVLWPVLDPPIHWILKSSQKEAPA